MGVTRPTYTCLVVQDMCQGDGEWIVASIELITQLVIRTAVIWQLGFGWQQYTGILLP